ncbi:conserved Plasmodium protein, unknown function [Plasmodium relictum]|uniref:ENTH domain-containing protein n=1 Tax=Plasmodium relictum TaxID=85471 RepID=A0A1J1H8M4_PLARL|nr:conserved Plasmodium protein, unknown function [Plasmodium relictum]CRH01329.1 conserved Plasmodium protein, unknown function [Plasmodium relictum]
MNRLILNKATSSNDEPTPGYLYNEISQMTFCSKESLVLVGEYLLKKLQRTDLNVKLKTLKILKHLCDKKRSDFRTFLKKKIDIIKECQTCNIVNDELKGETPTMLVRKEASDLIKLIYSYDTIESNAKSISNNNQDIMKNNRIEGFGNKVFEKSDHYNRNDRIVSDINANKSLCNKFHNKSYMNKMSGFGNPYFNQNPSQKTKGEIAFKYLNEVANKYIPSSFVSKINKVSASITKNYSNGSLNIQSIMNGNSFNKSFEKNNIKKVENHNYSYDNYPNLKRIEKIRKPQESQISGIYETKIIDDILNTTGIKKIPSENVLNEFAQKCETLDTKLIVSILTSKLKNKFPNEEENWKYKFKVLCVIKHLLIHRKKKEKEKTIETFESLVQNLKNQTLEELYRSKEIKQLKKQITEIFILMGLQQKHPTDELKKEFKENIEIPNLLDIDDDIKVNNNNRNTTITTNITANINTTTTTNNNSNNDNNKNTNSYFDNTNLIIFDSVNNSTDTNPTKISDICYDDTNNNNNNLLSHLNDTNYYSNNKPTHNLDPSNYKKNNNCKSNENSEKKYHNERLIYNLDNFSTSNNASNNELFNSLNVKYSNKINAPNSNNIHKMTLNNTLNSRNKGNNNLERTNDLMCQNNSFSKITTDYNISSDLIFIDDKNDDNKKNISLLNNKSSEINLNYNDSFFHFESNNIDNNSNHNLVKTLDSENSYFNNISQIKHYNSNNLNLNNSSNTKNIYDLNDNLDILNIEKDNSFKKNDLKAVNNCNTGVRLIDINENLCTIKSKSFDNITSYENKYLNNLQNNENAKNYRSFEDISKKSNNGNNKHLNDINNFSDKFENSLNDSMKIDDEHISNFFNTFTISSKKSEECNNKPNVKIDAFELLADELKL